MLTTDIGGTRPTGGSRRAGALPALAGLGFTRTRKNTPKKIKLSLRAQKILVDMPLYPLLSGRLV
jgi:hypothetical protein